MIAKLAKSVGSVQIGGPMRILLSAFLLLAACGPKASDSAQQIDAKPAALTFEAGNDTTDTGRIGHGKRLADILDCTGCHGSNLQGSNLGTADGPMYAPNVTLLMAQYSNAELDKLIRGGVPKDGREFWYMPVESYQFLSDADVGALIGYLRTLKPSGKQTPPFTKSRALEKELAAGIIGNAQVQMAKYRKDPPADVGAQYAWGRYLTRNSCSGCHNNALQGWEGFSPNLDLAGAYSKAELRHLLTTGEGKLKKDLGPMTAVVKNNFSKLTKREREAIVEYVLARANRPQ